MAIRLCGERFETVTPHWLLNAAQSHSAAHYLRRIATELNRAPELYGFDPGSLYSVCVQTWDRASDPIASLAFGRETIGNNQIGLIPDIYYIDSAGYRALRRQSAEALPWANRLDMVIWRGSVTGSGPYEEADDIPRIQLAKVCKTVPGADVALFAVHATMANVFPIDRINAFIDSHALRGNAFGVVDFARYRYTIDIDGHANAWGLLEKLILGCCVLKVASPYEQWYYDRLKPWVHYVPVSADFSDLIERIEWCRSHAEQCAWIAANGALLAATLTIEHELPRSCHEFIRVARQKPANASARRVCHRHLATVLAKVSETPFDLAEKHENSGNFLQAIAEYKLLSQSPGQAAEAFKRQAELHQELGQISEAITTLRQAATVEGDDLKPKLSLAHALSALNRDSDAIALLVDTQKGGTFSTEAGVFVAQAATRLGWYDMAYWALPALHEHEPDWWTDARARARCDFQSHRETLKQLLHRKKDLGDRRWDLAIALYSVGRLSPAWRICSALLAEQPGSHVVIGLQAKIIARCRGAAAALDFLRSLPVILQEGEEFVLSFTRYLTEVGEYEALLELAPDAEKSSVGGRYEVRLATALALLWLKRPASLIEHCRTWLEHSQQEIIPAALVSRLAVPAIPAATPMLQAPVHLAHYWQQGTPPVDVAFTQSSWLARHPQLEPQSFDRASARAFLQAEHGGTAVTAFDHCPDAKAEALLFGLAWLDRSGGLFIDADQFCARPMSTVIGAASRAELIAPRAGTLLGFLKNGFIGGRAGSRIIRVALAAAISALNSDPIETLSVWHALGAGLLTLETGRYLMGNETALSDGTVILLPSHFYDRHVRTDRALAYKRAS